MPEITHDPVTVVRVPKRCDSDFVVSFVPRIESTIKGGSSTEILVDLSQAAFVNSASLGAFLLLRDRAQDVGRSVTLVNPSGDIQKTLHLVGFHRLFKFQ